MALGAMGGIFFSALLGLTLPVDVSALADRPFESIETGGFAFTFERTVPGNPRETYDAMTGDISGWWDHTVSGNPNRLYIEARPGGGFFEIFDESGNGVRHAVVTAAERGALLRFEGPLGLAGNALTMVATLELAEVGLEGTSTNLRVTVHAAGEMQDGWAEAVENVWHHFIDERFVPYVEAGGNLDEGG
jgi:uncharacterized protein YndB with AHSA1/START domain